MSDQQHELTITEVPSPPPELPPSPAEHMPAPPDPMKEIEPLLGALQDLSTCLSHAAQTAQDLKWTLGGLVLTAHVPTPLAANDTKAEDGESM